MPLRSEYSCRLREPEEFQKKSFRRIQSGDVDLIIARPRGMKKTRAQAIRYPRELWDKKSAQLSCRKRKGTFEPVTPLIPLTRGEGGLGFDDLGRAKYPPDKGGWGGLKQPFFVISIRYPDERSFRRIGTVGGKLESERVKELYQRKGFHVRAKKM